MWPTNKYLSAVAFAIAVAAYLGLWHLAEFPGALSFRNYALVAAKVFSWIGLFVCAQLVVGWCAKRIRQLREGSHEGT